MTTPNFSLPSIPREDLNEIADNVRCYLVVGSLLGRTISILSLTSHSVNPWATGLACGIYILARRLFSFTITEQSPRILKILDKFPISEKKAKKDFVDQVYKIIAIFTITAAGTAAFAVYAVTSTLSYKLSLVAFVVSIVGSAILFKLTAEPEEGSLTAASNS